MGLEEEAVNEIVDLYRYSRGVGSETIYVNPEDKTSFTYKKFTFKLLPIQNNDIIMSFRPPKDVDPELFDQFIKRTQHPSFYDRYPDIKDKRRSLNKYIKNMNFTQNSQGNYHGKAKYIPPRNKIMFRDKLVQGLIGYFVQPVMLFTKEASRQ